jgi:hypothetical protein
VLPSQCGSTFDRSSRKSTFVHGILAVAQGRSRIEHGGAAVPGLLDVVVTRVGGHEGYKPSDN